MGWQDTNPQLRLSVEVEEAMGAVDIVEGGKGGDAAINRHGVGSQFTLPSEEKPVGIGSRDKDTLIVLDVWKVPQTWSHNRPRRHLLSRLASPFSEQKPMFQLFEAELQLVLPQRPVEKFKSLIYCQLPIFGSGHQQGSSAFAS